MKRGYPTLKLAEEIWKKGIEFREKNYGYPDKIDYIFHSKTVGTSAKIIAENTLYLNPEKAYILGLLHDYGKKHDEKIYNKFHGQVGYEELMEMGYPACARICLTHSFPKRDFNDNAYTSFRPEWLVWVHEKLSNITKYDDYDRLIQLCDMFSEGTNKVSFERRFSGIEERYNLKLEQTKDMRLCAEINKSYFDKLCNKNIYELLAIEV